MAKKVDQMPGHQRKRYDWGNWFDGDVWELTQVDDFPGLEPEVFRNTVLARAREMGGRATTAVVGDVVTIQFFAKRKGRRGAKAK